ncbi:MAG: hypothetical protein MUO76_06550 [Anaerolineaceae bacterium]|nr:hypothetical protein [Anaerolineaceae bacterium]
MLESTQQVWGVVLDFHFSGLCLDMSTFFPVLEVYLSKLPQIWLHLVYFSAKLDAGEIIEQ